MVWLFVSSRLRLSLKSPVKQIRGSRWMMRDIIIQGNAALLGCLICRLRQRAHSGRVSSASTMAQGPRCLLCLGWLAASRLIVDALVEKASPSKSTHMGSVSSVVAD